MTTVLLVAPHALVRAALRAALERDARVTIIAEAETTADAIGRAGAGHPDVVITLAGRLTTAALAATTDLRGALGGARLVLVLDAADGHDVADALQAGVSAVLPRGAGLTELATAVHEARAGRRFLPPSAAAMLLEGLAAGESPRAEARRRLDSLSAREREVLHLVLDGASSAEVASALGISSHTADTHRRRALGKLAVDDAATLFQFALRHGLLRTPP